MLEVVKNVKDSLVNNNFILKTIYNIKTINKMKITNNYTTLEQSLSKEPHVPDISRLELDCS